MKRIFLSMVLCLSLTQTIFASTRENLQSSAVNVRSNREIKVIINGETMQFDQPPVMLNNRVMVPIRAVFEAVGFNVSWNENAKCAIVSNGKKMLIIYMKENNIKYYDNETEKNYYCDVPPQIINGRVMIPIRAVAETALQNNIGWNNESKVVTISATPVSSQNNGDMKIGEGRYLYGKGTEYTSIDSFWLVETSDYIISNNEYLVPIDDIISNLVKYFNGNYHVPKEAASKILNYIGEHTIQLRDFSLLLNADLTFDKYTSELYFVYRDYNNNYDHEGTHQKTISRIYKDKLYISANALIKVFEHGSSNHYNLKLDEYVNCNYSADIYAGKVNKVNDKLVIPLSIGD